MNFTQIKMTNLMKNYYKKKMLNSYDYALLQKMRENFSWVFKTYIIFKNRDGNELDWISRLSPQEYIDIFVKNAKDLLPEISDNQSDLKDQLLYSLNCATLFLFGKPYHQLSNEDQNTKTIENLLVYIMFNLHTKIPIKKSSYMQYFDLLDPDCTHNLLETIDEHIKTTSWLLLYYDMKADEMIEKSGATLSNETGLIEQIELYPELSQYLNNLFIQYQQISNYKAKLMNLKQSIAKNKRFKKACKKYNIELQSLSLDSDPTDQMEQIEQNK